MSYAVGNAIGSLSLVSGAALLVVANMIFALPFLATRRRAVQWVAALVIPAVVAYTAYWFPVWFAGGSAAEYFSWAFLFYIAWSGAGIVGFAAVLIAQFFIQKQHLAT